MNRDFPVVNWGDRQVTFRSFASALPTVEPCAAALVFPLSGDRVLLADIRDRGWCIPGGRIEPGEAPEKAARREAWEECGAALGPLIALGATVALTAEGREITLAISYVSNVVRVDPVPAGSESLGIRFAARDELHVLYYRWDELMAAMFDSAWEHLALVTER